MKLYNCLLIALLASSCLFLSACNDDENINNGDPSKNLSDPVVQATHLIVDQALSQQIAICEIYKTLTNGYQNSLMMTYPSESRIDSMYMYMRRAMENADELESALNTLAAAKSSEETARILGLKDKMLGFVNYMTGSSSRARKRLLKVGSNLNDADKDKIYDDLPASYKAYASNGQDFWNKVQAGELDEITAQVYNNLYHRPSLEFSNYQTFQGMADSYGLSIGKIAYKEGAEGIKAGSEMYVEVIKTVAGSSFTKGIEYAEKAAEYAEKAEETYKSPTNGVRDWVAPRIDLSARNAIAGLLEIDTETIIDEGIFVAKVIKPMVIMDYVIQKSVGQPAIKNGLAVGDLTNVTVVDSDTDYETADICLAFATDDETNKTEENISGALVISINEAAVEDPSLGREFNFTIPSVSQNTLAGDSYSEYTTLVLDTDGFMDINEFSVAGVDAAIDTIEVVATTLYDSWGNIGKNFGITPPSSSGLTIATALSANTVYLEITITGTDILMTNTIMNIYWAKPVYSSTNGELMLGVGGSTTNIQSGTSSQVWNYNYINQGRYYYIEVINGSLKEHFILNNSSIPDAEILPLITAEYL